MSEPVTITPSSKHCVLCGGHEHDKGTLVGKEQIRVCYLCAVEALDVFKGDEDIWAQCQELERTHQDELLRKAHASNRLPDPRELFKEISRNVIAQNRAKTTIATAAVQHQKNILARMIGLPIEMQKGNILLIGPTGVGKTEIARSLAGRLKVPFAIGDATCLSEAGYVGEDVENLLLRLIQAAEGDIPAAERGVIFIDEIDKIGKRSSNVSITRDVSGEGVQQALLKILEGTESNVPPNGGRKHPEQQYLRIDTHNILFICGGTFDGIEDIVAERTAKKRIGFGQDSGASEDDQQTKDELREQITPDDLAEFGMIPELIGRLPKVATLHSLDVDNLQKILGDRDNSLVNQAIQSAYMGNVELEFEKAALKEISERAYKLKTGARGLETIMAKLMEPIEFNMGDYHKQHIVITQETVRQCLDEKTLHVEVKKSEAA